MLLVWNAVMPAHSTCQTDCLFGHQLSECLTHKTGCIVGQQLSSLLFLFKLDRFNVFRPLVQNDTKIFIFENIVKIFFLNLKLDWNMEMFFFLRMLYFVLWRTVSQNA